MRIMNSIFSELAASVRSSPVAKSRRRYCAEDVARMFELRNSGYSWPKIGNEFGVCGKSVYEVCNRALVNGFDSYPPRKAKK